MDSARAPDIDALMVHAGLVRHVARAVLHGDDRVEDVAQETWVAASRGGPRDAAASRGWLSRVARRFALAVRRGDASRARRERAVARADGVPSALEIAEREETRRTVVDALLHVEEPFRSALLLRYYEGLPPRAIARRLEIPVETARSRVRRGLERLRERLVADAGPARRRRLAALAAVSPAGWAALFPFGALLMTPKAVGVAAAMLVLAAGAGWYWMRPGGESPARVETGSAGDAAAPSPTLVGRVGKPAKAPAAAAPEAPSATAPIARRLLRGRLAGVQTPLRGPVRLTVHGLGTGGKSPTEVLSGDAAPAGTFEVDVTSLVDGKPRPVELEVRVDAPDYMPGVARVPLSPAATELAGETVIELRRAGALVGKLVTEDGTPVPGGFAALFASEPGPDGRSIETVRTGPDGAFRLRAAADGKYLLAADADDLRPAWRRESLRVGTERAVAPLVLTRGVAISGTVRAASLPGVPLTVEVSATGPERPMSSLYLRTADGTGYRDLTWSGDALEKAEREVAVSPAGAFRVTGLAPTPHRLKPGRARVEGVYKRDEPVVHRDLSDALTRTVTAPATGIDLELAGGLLVIEVTTPRGPAARATVLVSGVNEAEVGETTGMFWLSTDDQGDSRILVRPGAEYEVEVSAGGHRKASRRVRAPGRGAEQTERFALESEIAEVWPPFTVTLTRGDGKDPGLATARFVLRPETSDGDEVWDAAAKSEGGRFRLEGWPPGRWRLTVDTTGIFVGGAIPYLDATALVEVPKQGGGAATIPLTLGGWLMLSAMSPDGRRIAARCRLLDGSGERVKRNFVVRFSGNAAGGSGVLSENGPSRVEPALPAGKYAIELSADGFVDQRLEAVVKAGEMTVVEAALLAR